MSLADPKRAQTIAFTATIRHLRAYLTVARFRSFTRASAELNLSQPSLTTIIQQLEHIVGAPLFDRTTRQVSLTSEGQELRPHAERLVDEFDATIREIRLTASTRARCVRIGTVASIARLLPMVLAPFLASRPDVRIQFREGNSNEVRRMVRQSEVDVGFATASHDGELAHSLLFQDQLVLYAPKNHPLTVKARDGEIEWKDLEGHDFVGVTRDTAIGPIIEQMPDLPASVTRPRYEVSTYTSLWALVEHGLAITVAPALAAEFLAGSQIAVLPLREPVPWRSVHLLTREGHATAPNTQELVAAVEEELVKIAANHPRIRLAVTGRKKARKLPAR